MNKASKALAKELPSQDELRRMFDYDVETGNLIWKYRAELDSQWNGRMVGRVAGGFDRYGYRRLEINDIKYQAHRVIWKLAYGEIPNYLQVDHINGSKGDNRLENLRLVTNQQNQHNRQCDNGRQFKGVYKHRRKWKAEITTAEGRKYLGLHETAEKAALEYDKAARRHFGAYAVLNFPNVVDIAA
jgi:hypothetical protein